MASDKLEINKEYICREQISGDFIAGQLMLTDDEFRVRLVSFDDFFFLNGENEVLPVRLEDNSYPTQQVQQDDRLNLPSCSLV